MKYQDRDLSWLSFNSRILQEIADEKVPLLERLNFVAIYSSNLEEFYKVRVAGQRFEQRYKGDVKNKFGYRPSYILEKINHIVCQQQEDLGFQFFQKIVPSLVSEGVVLLNHNLQVMDMGLIYEYYQKNLENKFTLQEITNEDRIDLKNQVVYLFYIWRERLFLLELDYIKWGRFVPLYQDENEIRIIQLDDIFKWNVHRYLGSSAEIFAVKVSRDAELYIDEELDESVVKKIKKSLHKRETGLPSRLLFNENIPFKYINALRKRLSLDMNSLIPGGKYHNYYDFFQFSDVVKKSHLCYDKFSKIPCVRFENGINVFRVIKEKDVFLSYPYQDFQYVIDVLNAAACDDKVVEISVTLYRVNKDSTVCKALEKAAQNGKKVFVLTEVLARFDEESNIYWGERLEKAGAKVKFGISDLKVHAKIFAIKRAEKGKNVIYSYLGTGNLNEKTANLYADHGLLTASADLGKEVEMVFSCLKEEKGNPEFKHLLVAPFNLRDTLVKAVENEIDIAKSGGQAEIMVKLNSLEDPQMIDLLRKAADEGVSILMVVRGICCYIPLSEKQKQNIKIVSVVDRFLEHTRIYRFNNGGKIKTFLSSADWMTRNLSRRIEVAFPVCDEDIQEFLYRQMMVQLSDSIKGRLLTGSFENEKVDGVENKTSQEKMFDFVRECQKKCCSDMINK